MGTAMWHSAEWSEVPASQGSQGLTAITRISEETRKDSSLQVLGWDGGGPADTLMSVLESLKLGDYKFYYFKPPGFQ